MPPLVPLVPVQPEHLGATQPAQAGQHPGTSHGSAARMATRASVTQGRAAAKVSNRRLRWRRFRPPGHHHGEAPDPPILEDLPADRLFPSRAGRHVKPSVEPSRVIGAQVIADCATGPPTRRAHLERIATDNARLPCPGH